MTTNEPIVSPHLTKGHPAHRGNLLGLALTLLLVRLTAGGTTQTQRLTLLR